MVVSGSKHWVAGRFLSHSFSGLYHHCLRTIGNSVGILTYVCFLISPPQDVLDTIPPMKQPICTLKGFYGALGDFVDRLGPVWGKEVKVKVQSLFKRRIRPSDYDE